MDKIRVNKSELKDLANNAIDNGQCVVIVPTLSSFKSGVSTFSRGNTSEIWVTGEALAANWEEIEVAHLGQVETRVKVYTTAQRLWDDDGMDLYVFEPVSITVLDLIENNGSWDKYGELSNAEKRQVLSELGAIHLKNSNRGVKGLKGDCQSRWEKARK